MPRQKNVWLKHANMEHISQDKKLQKFQSHGKLKKSQ